MTLSQAKILAWGRAGIAGSDRAPLAALLLILFCSQIIVATWILKVSGWVGFIHDDTESYLLPARSLLHGSFSAKGAPEILRTPGYPLFLSLANTLGHYEKFALLENFLFAVLSGLLIYLIAKEIFPVGRAPLWALALYCCEPLSFLCSEKLISEALFGAQFLFFLWILLKFLRNPEFKKLIAAAVVLGLATYTRPVGLFLALWLIPFLLAFPVTQPWRRRILAAVLFPVTVALVLAPWIVRNEVVAEYPGFAATSDYNLYFMYAAAVTARQEHKSFAEISNYYRYEELHPEEQSWPQAQRYLHWRREAVQVLRKHPLSYLPAHLRGCAVVLFDPGVIEVKAVRLLPARTDMVSGVVEKGIVGAGFAMARRYPFAVFILALMGLQLMVYYALGLRGWLRLPVAIRGLFLALGLYFVLISGGPSGQARYRMPLMLLLCVCGGKAVAEHRANRSSHGDRASGEPIVASVPAANVSA